LFPKVCAFRKMKCDLIQNSCKIPYQVIFDVLIILKILNF